MKRTIITAVVFTTALSFACAVKADAIDYKKSKLSVKQILINGGKLISYFTEHEPGSEFVAEVKRDIYMLQQGSNAYRCIDASYKNRVTSEYKNLQNVCFELTD